MAETVLMLIGAGALVWLGTKMGPSAGNDYANTSGLPAFALAILLVVWACVRLFA